MTKSPNDSRPTEAHPPLREAELWQPDAEDSNRGRRARLWATRGVLGLLAAAGLVAAGSNVVGAFATRSLTDGWGTAQVAPGIMPAAPTEEARPDPVDTTEATIPANATTATPRTATPTHPRPSTARPSTPTPRPTPTASTAPHVVTPPPTTPAPPATTTAVPSTTAPKPPATTASSTSEPTKSTTKASPTKPPKTTPPATTEPADPTPGGDEPGTKPTVRPT